MNTTNDKPTEAKREEHPQDWKTYTILGRLDNDDTGYELVKYDYDTLNGAYNLTMQTHAGRYATEQQLVTYMAESLIHIAEYRLRDYIQNEYENEAIPTYIPNFELRAAAMLSNIASIANSLHELAFYELNNPQHATEALAKLAEQADIAAACIETSTDGTE